MFTIENVAERVPIAVGKNVIVTVVLLNAGTEAAGGVVTVNSEAFGPPIVIAPSVKAMLPLLNMVKVLVPAVELKSVQSAVVGVASPSVIDVALP